VTRRNDGEGVSGAEVTQRRQLLGAADVVRTIARMAHQVIERNELGATADQRESDVLVLLGIPNRGVGLAVRLAERITAFSGIRVPVGTLDVTLHRDDLRRGPARAIEATELPACGVDDRTVILVDDVLYSGRTVRAALDALRDLGRPRAVQLAVLIDRGHRELPIRADYVGKNIPTSRDEDVAVRLADTDGVDAVVLRRSSR
jgi:pyrimidine operon attenuation protein/uracil phosphoribosyltransferase